MTNRGTPPRLAALPKFGSGIGLHRMRRMLDRLAVGLPGADPWLHGLDAIKITGSNGKGSVAAMLSSIFTQLPVSCGTYTSPHLFDFSERIVVDGEPISAADLDAASDWLFEQDALRRRKRPDDEIGAFEAITAIAMRHFATREVDVVVAEAGIGGRYDSTRVLPGKIAALTSIDLEHTQLLGATRELIAYDKADLCEPGGTLVVGELEEELLDRLEVYASLRDIEIVPCLEGAALLEGLSLPPGRHQRSNAAVAALCAMRWAARNRPEWSTDDVNDAVRRGLEAVRLPGRMEKISDDPEVYIDVAHTPAAVHATAETVREVLPGRRILLVAGVSDDKDLHEILTPLAPLAEAAICFRARERGTPAEEVADSLRELRPELQVDAAENSAGAYAAASDRAAREGLAILVGGGLFAAREFAEEHRRSMV